MGTFRNKIVLIGVALLMVATLVLAILAPNVQQLMMTDEEKLTLTYPQYGDEDYATESENVKFLAYFLKDLNNDGWAEKLGGTTSDVSSGTQLYLDLNVISDGTLEDGVITLSDNKNFKYNLSYTADAVLKKNYISGDVKSIELNPINAGTKSLIIGSISADIRYSRSFSKTATITLTGTHVSSDGETRTPINKEVNITVDWYGTTKTSITAKSKDIKISARSPEEIHESYRTVSASFKTNETVGKLPLKSTNVVIKVPSMNGIPATNAYIEGGTWDYETQTLTVTRNNCSSSNTYTYSVTYPENAFERINFEENGTTYEDTFVELTFDITASYTGENNPNYTNPYTSSNEAKQRVILNFDFGEEGPYAVTYKTEFGELQYRDRDKDKVMLLKPLLDAYDSDDNYFYYTEYWTLVNNTPESLSAPALANRDTDKFGERSWVGIAENYSVWFSGLEEALGDEGEIHIYNIIENDAVGSFGDEVKELRGYITLDDKNVLLGGEGAVLNQNINHGGKGYGYSSQGKDEYVIGKRRESETSISKMQIEFSEMKPFTSIVVCVKKRVNLNYLRDTFTRNEILNTRNMTTFLEVRGSLNSGRVSAVANLAKPQSYATISSTRSIPTQTEDPDEPYTNTQINIGAGVYQITDSDWKDGIFFVKMPAEFIDVKVNSVTTPNSQLQIRGYELDQDDNGVYYIKILTANDTLLRKENICIDADVLVDPRTSSKTSYYELYYENKNCKDYSKSTADIYDINDNGVKTDAVGYVKNSVSIVAPTRGVVCQVASNYDNLGRVTVSPNVAEITKETRSADIELYFYNNCPGELSNMTILGKVPYENNKYVLTDRYIGSTYTATMKDTGISVPNSIKNYTTVYYSEVEEPTKDITNAANGWVTAENVTDWTKIKTYLIKINEQDVRIGAALNFKYSVTVPEGLQYNDTAYSTFSIYYELNTSEGKLIVETEPSKLGLKVTRAYKAEFGKYKEGFNLPISSAIYQLTEINSAGQIDTQKTLISDANGLLKAKRLHVNAVYELREISAPENYMLNGDTIKFKVQEGENGTLSVVTLSEATFRNTPQISKVDGADVLTAEIADAPRYVLNLTYVDGETNEPIDDVIFEINDKMYTTNHEGKVTTDILDPGTEYTIEEVFVRASKAKDYDFTFTRLDVDDYTFDSDEGMTYNGKVNNGEEDLITVNATITKQTNPRYTLNLVKVEKDGSVTSISDMKKLEGAEFRLQKKDDNRVETVVTDENGVITLNNLYQYVEGADLSGEYTIQEITAPNGYVLNNEEITFRVKKVNDKLTFEVIKADGESDPASIKDVQIEGNVVNLVIHDAPYFKLTKTDSEDGTFLPGAKFVIVELVNTAAQGLSPVYEKAGYAKDINGNFVGEENENGQYVVTTNSAGEISLPLRNGVYEIEEIEAPEGYYGNYKQVFEVNNEYNEAVSTTTNNNSSEEEEEEEEFVVPETSNTVEINYIEDLLTLHQNIIDPDNGTNYANTKVVLMRDLDFNDPNSYSSDLSVPTTYGDINEDEEISDLKTELTTGKGFLPIGLYKGPYESSSGTIYMINKYDKPFSGVFDGQNHEIKNFYSNRSDTGLFNMIENAVFIDMGIVANDAKSSGGLFTAYATGDISFVNCYTKGTAQVSGGLIGNYSNYNYGDKETGTSHNVLIKDCYNEGTISGGAGLIGIFKNNDKVIVDTVKFVNCYNKGTVASGLVNTFDGITDTRYIEFKNCYNEGNIIGDYNAGGMIGRLNIYDSNEYRVRSLKITNCVNKCETLQGQYLGGMIGNVDGGNNNSTDVYNVEITNCENKALIQGYEIGGMVGLSYTRGKFNIKFENCENNGNIQGNYAGGIVGYQSGTFDLNMTNCNNNNPINGSSYVGGLFGYATGSGRLKIDNSNNYADMNNGSNFGTSCNYFGGLVGGISDSVNAEITNSNNYGKCVADGCYYAAGGIVGGASCTSLVVVNCKVPDFTAKNVRNYAGGIVGGYSSVFIIQNCEFKGELEGKYVGGILGYNEGNGGAISNCNVNANITSNASYGNGGGIAGKYASTISGCTFKGKLEYSGSEDSVWMGGIVGYYNGTGVYNCINYANINLGLGRYCGGIVGYSYNSATISNCFNYGNITSIARSTIGGILGNGQAIITNSCNTGNIFDINKNGPNDAGGIVGYHEGSNSVISCCYNTGNISGNSRNVGGLAGNASGYITNCYNEGNVTGTSFVGGLVGGYSSPRAISNSYNIGNVAVIQSNFTGIGSWLYAGSLYSQEASSSNFSKAYCLDTINVVGGTVNAREATQVTKEYMASDEFYNTLNNSGVWIQRTGKAPTLKLKMPSIGTVSELEATNTKQEYIISTTVVGSGGTITGSDELVYETVEAGKSSTKAIDATPLTSQGYVLSSLKVNGIPANYQLGEEGIATLPVGYFEDMDEDKMVVATFVKPEKALTIKKVDQDTNEPLEGAIIKVEKDFGPSYNNTRNLVATVTTDKNGEAQVILTDFQYDYVVTEVEAPEGYILDSTEHVIHPDGTTTDNNLVTLQNKAKPAVIAHYYLKENGEYTTKKVAEDEIYKGDVGSKYQAEYKDLEEKGLSIERNTNGDAVLPINMNGVFDENQTIEVNFYYESMDIDLTIHHYREGTTTKLVDDEVIPTASQVNFAEDGSYNVVLDSTYTLNTNTNYQTLTSNRYNLVNVYSDVDDDLNIEGTLEYNTNAELAYTYEDRTYTITTRVAEHQEVRMVDEEEVTTSVKGGTISGDGLIAYETVIVGEDATKDIVVTANEGYLIKNITVTSIAEDGTETSKVLYGEGAEACEISYTGDEETGTISKFEDLQENKLVTVEFKLKSSQVLVHHIIEGTNEDYQTNVISKNVGDEYTTSPITIEHYELVRNTLNTAGTVTEETIHVYYFYDLVDSIINLEYRDIISNDLLDQEEVEGKYGNTITLADYAKTIENYTLRELPEEETATFGTSDEPYVFKYAKNASVRTKHIKQGTQVSVADDVVENGYEGKAYTTSPVTLAKYDLVVTPANAEGTMAVTDETSETLVVYEYALKAAKVNVKYVDINKETENVVETETINGHVDDPYNVEGPNVPAGYVLMEENAQGESILPTNTQGTMTASDIDVIYYVAKAASVRAIYVEEGTTSPKLAEDYTEAGYEGKAYTTSAKVVDGYTLKATPANANGTMTVTDESSETLVVYEYVRVEANVVERYVDINSNEVVSRIDHPGHVGDPYEIEEPTVPEGYVLMEENAQGESILPTNTEGTMTEEEIVVTYYVARAASVRAIYVKEGTTSPKLAPDYTEAGYEGKSYITNAKTIEGYTLKATPLNANGTMSVTATSNETLVVYEYKEIEPQVIDTKVVEKYVDINSNETVSSIDHNGHVGDPYEITGPTVPNGYVLIEENAQGESILPTNTEGTMTEDIIEVVYYVAKVAKVTVKYIDIDTNANLAETVEIPGYEGKAYTAEEKEFEEYNLVEIEGTVNGNMTAGNQEVIYKYEAEEEPVRDAYVRVIYIDTETKEKIAEDTIIEGYEGKPYQTTAKEIADYELLLVPTNARGTMTITEDIDGNINNETLVTYIYMKRKPTKVVEKYVDINSEEVVESKEHPGKVGDAYEVTPTIPDGYVLMEKDKDGKDILPENTKGRMTEETIEVVYYVAKDAKVTVKYVVRYDNDNVGEDVIIPGYEGKEYKAEEKKIDGYELVGVEGEKEGKMKAGDNIVTFYYAKKATGIIPQTGINVFLYAMFAITVIVVANGSIFVIYKFKK